MMADVTGKDQGCTRTGAYSTHCPSAPEEGSIRSRAVYATCYVNEPADFTTRNAAVHCIDALRSGLLSLQLDER
jgi:hypothetical protein